MMETERLIAQLAAEGSWWEPGAVGEDDVDALEIGLGVRLPQSYRQFLITHGGGGVDGLFELCGLEPGRACDPEQGTVYGQTMHDRRELGLPTSAVVILRDFEDSVHYLNLACGEDPPVMVRDLMSGGDGDWEPFAPYLHAWLKSAVADTK